MGQSRSLLRLMGLVFAGALLVRVAYVIALRGSPFFEFLSVDAQWHHQWAEAIARGEWSMGDRAFFRAPLYPFWLSLLYRLLGENLLAVRLAQAVLGAGAASLLAGAVWRMAGRRAAIWSGILVALYGPLVFFDGELLIPNLLILLLSGLLFLLAGSLTPATAAASGLLLGLAGIARPNALALLPVGLVWVWWTAGGSRRRRASLGALLIALALVPALGVTLANYRAEGVAVFVGSQGGVNFYAGNHARASGRSVEIPEIGGVEGGWAEFVEATRWVAEEGRVRSLNSAEVSAYWFERGREWIRSDPAGALGLTLRKTYYLANAYEIPNNRDPYARRPAPLAPLLWKTSFLAFPWGLLFPLAVAGAVIGWRRGLRGPVALAVGWMALYGMSLLPFFVCGRFRLGLVPGVILLAAVALSRWRDLRPGAPLVAGLAALVLVNTTFLETRADNPGQELARLGVALHTQGRLAEGREHLERAWDADPRSAKTAYLLAQAHDLEDRRGDAILWARRSLELVPSSPVVFAGVGAILLRHGLFAEAEPALRRAVVLRPGSATAWMDLGRAQEGLGQVEEAGAAYQRAIELEPHAPRGYLHLGYLHRAAGALDAAAETWSRGASRCPESGSLWFNLALVLAETGDRAGAVSAAETAARLRPGDEEIQKVLRWLREQRGTGR